MEENAIVLRPLLTEKTNFARSDHNKFYFEVHPNANKVMVKKALAKLYEVTIEKCNIYNLKGKKSRTRHGTSFGKKRKKVVVTLKQGDSFDFYEGI